MLFTFLGLYREPQSGMIPRGWRRGYFHCLGYPVACSLASRAAAAGAAAAVARVAVCATRCHTNLGLKVSLLRVWSPPLCGFRHGGDCGSVILCSTSLVRQLRVVPPCTARQCTAPSVRHGEGDPRALLRRRFWPGHRCRGLWLRIWANHCCGAVRLTERSRHGLALRR